MLPILGGKVFTDVTVAQNSTGYTTAHLFQRCSGYATVQVSVSAGVVTISQQCSIDGRNWYDPVDNAGAAIGITATSMSSGTAYIQYAPVLARHMRYKIVEGNVAAATVGIILNGQEAD